MAAACGLLASSPAAQAEDFLSALFGAFGARPPASATPFAGDNGQSGPQNQSSPQSPIAPPRDVQRPRGSGYGGGQAYCVRGCDGRYFPTSGSDHQSRAALCNSFCPASKTAIVYGSSIDSATTESGTPYSELPNAFRYRNEIVAGCSCNGRDQIGLAPVQIENDPTLRRGDLVAGSNGLLVTGRNNDRRGAALSFSPTAKALSGINQRVPVVAAE